MALKDDWKKTGSDLGHAFQGLGKSILRSAKVGIDKADAWASSDDSQETKDDQEVKTAEVVENDQPKQE